ncbi:hypothetical protein AMTRI_Chr04g189550 [Amborella trichopoda]
MEEEQEDDPKTLITGLPDDLGLQCIARVPRVYHQTLAQVCKPWRSLVRSELFVSARSSLKTAQHFLYFMVRTHDSCFKWFVLSHYNHLKQTCPLPPAPAPTMGSACVVLGSSLYILGGSINDLPSPNTWVYDACLNSWRNGPRMRVAREFAAAGTINQKIYVVGGCQADTWARSASWAEVFDQKVGHWAPIPSPIEMREKWMHGNAVLKGKLLAMADRGGVVDDPRGGTFDGSSNSEKLGSWSFVSMELDTGWRGRAAVVKGILFCYDFLGKIRGYDSEEDKWMELQGVKKSLPKFLCGASLANVGEKLYVVWEGLGRNKETELLCAEVDVENKGVGLLWGTVVWYQVILSLPKGASTIHCLSLGL